MSIVIPTKEDYDTLEKAKIYILKNAKENPSAPENIIASNIDVFQLIFRNIKEEYDYVSRLLKEHVIQSNTSYIKSHIYDNQNMFPPPSDININMMPIDMVRLKDTLPDYAKGYTKLILFCIRQQMEGWLRNDVNEKGKIAYLTIHESWVEPGKTQRRPGLHIESPLIYCDSNIIGKCPNNQLWRSLAWGKGNWRDDHPIDGIYIASNIDNMTNIYPYQIEKSEELTDKYGGIEYLREDIKDGEYIKMDMYIG